MAILMIPILLMSLSRIHEASGVQVQSPIISNKSVCLILSAVVLMRLKIVPELYWFKIIF